MPQSPPRICSRCRGTKPGTCKCAVRGPDRRESAAKRGYDYRWQQFTKQYKARNPLCRDCEAEGLVRAAEHIHHVKKLADHPEHKYDEEFLMPLCEEHHNRRTVRGE